jgi:RES domain-containing protein
MLVYRIGNAMYAGDLTGEGAKIHGGRWNHITVPCLYTSGSRALTVLEYSVNVNISKILRALAVTTIEIQDATIMEMQVADLPGNWRESPAPSSTKDFGSALLMAADFPVIKIPSTIIPEEYNYILNPHLRDAKKFRIKETKDFIYDVRIKFT